MANKTMTRTDLEESIYERLRITKPSDEPVLRGALKLKTTQELKDLLERMKTEGR